VGCCDSSPGQHATGHFEESGHAVAQSFEPGEDWFWDFGREMSVIGPELAPPTSRPADQEPPAPLERVPANWQDLLN